MKPLGTKKSQGFLLIWTQKNKQRMTELNGIKIIQCLRKIEKN
jgi:hypothetical protein